MELFELLIDEEEGFIGTYAYSFVLDPANQAETVLLSKEYNQNFSEVDSERRIMMGAALIPNQKIVRKNKETGELYEVFFSAETIRKTAENFLKNGFQSNATYEHSSQLEGVTVVESWIVDDPEKDKSAVNGLSFPKGTWMMSIQTDDVELWNERIKTGEVLGISIEGKYNERKVENPQEVALSLLSELEKLTANL